MNMSRPSAKTTKPVSVSTSPVVIYKALFSNSSYASFMQERFNREGSLSCTQCKTLPPVSFLVGWINAVIIFGSSVSCEAVGVQFPDLHSSHVHKERFITQHWLWNSGS
jgi:hypothetical protein